MHTLPMAWSNAIVPQALPIYTGIEVNIRMLMT